MYNIDVNIFVSFCVNKIINYNFCVTCFILLHQHVKRVKFKTKSCHSYMYLLKTCFMSLCKTCVINMFQWKRIQAKHELIKTH